MNLKNRYTVVLLTILWLGTNNNLLAQSSLLKLWYTKPASKWTEALPIGNGRIGAMIFGGIEQDRIQFNEETLWTGEPRNYNRPGTSKYLDTIRQLLFSGKQEEAEALAEKEFMGLKSNEGSKVMWVKNMLLLKGMKANPATENF
ncbi:MAG TPA: glycoside hydrolase N-terminal domain-containing protein, partial [Chitinophagaceae bacterium]|nr:glycoside hydrolase N-terminal domain-containing protein [Chitinophagaceae bacterium]